MGQFCSSILGKSNWVPHWLNKVEEVHFMKILSTSHGNHFHFFLICPTGKVRVTVMDMAYITWVRDVLGMRCLAYELFVVRVVLGTIFFFFFWGGGLLFLCTTCLGYELSIIRSHKCICLTHWGRVTHKCVGKLTIIVLVQTMACRLDGAKLLSELARNIVMLILPRRFRCQGWMSAHTGVG